MHSFPSMVETNIIHVPVPSVSNPKRESPFVDLSKMGSVLPLFVAYRSSKSTSKFTVRSRIGVSRSRVSLLHDLPLSLVQALTTTPRFPFAGVPIIPQATNVPLRSDFTLYQLLIGELNLYPEVLEAGLNFHVVPLSLELRAVTFSSVSSVFPDFVGTLTGIVHDSLPQNTGGMPLSYAGGSASSFVVVQVLPMLFDCTTNFKFVEAARIVPFPLTAHSQ